MLRSLVLAALVAAAPAIAIANEGADRPPKLEWSFEGPFGTFEQAAVQRGFQVYKEVCASCHVLRHLSYRHLGERGGPFVASGKFNAASGGWEDIHLGPPHHGGRLVPAADNPYIRAIAGEAQITEIDRTNGQEITRSGRPSDKFVSPYTNPYQAAATHGVAPPDLSLIVKARANGADYVHAILTGYRAPPAGEGAPGGAANLSYNKYFAGHWIAMAPQLTQDRVVYSDGTQATPTQMAHDVVTFLAWASEPKQTGRKRAGFAAMIYLTILAGLLYVAYRQVWRDVKH